MNRFFFWLKLGTTKYGIFSKIKNDLAKRKCKNFTNDCRLAASLMPLSINLSSTVFSRQTAKYRTFTLILHRKMAIKFEWNARIKTAEVSKLVRGCSSLCVLWKMHVLFLGCEYYKTKTCHFHMVYNVIFVLVEFRFANTNVSG